MLNEILIFKACRGTQQHEEIQLGLLYGILTDPKMAPKVYITAMISCFIHQSIQGAGFYYWLLLPALQRPDPG